MTAKPVLATLGRWGLNVLVAFDELGNAVIGGSPHETISSRLYKLRAAGSRPACWACAVLNLLFFQADHCANAVDWIDGESRSQVAQIASARALRAAPPS